MIFNLIQYIFKLQLLSEWGKIRPKYSATIAFSLQEDKDGTNNKQAGTDLYLRNAHQNGKGLK